MICFQAINFTVEMTFFASPSFIFSQMVFILFHGEKSFVWIMLARTLFHVIVSCFTFDAETGSVALFSFFAVWESRGFPLLFNFLHLKFSVAQAR